MVFREEGAAAARAGLRPAIQFLCWESAFALAFETWIGPVYLSGLAGELGVGIGLATVLTAVPFIGQVGQVYGLVTFRSIQSLRRHTVTLSIIGRSLWAIPLVLALILAARSRITGLPFPKQNWCLVTAVIACASSLATSASATGWMTWTRELVPDRFRGRFFGARQRHTMGALILANLVASSWVSWKPGGYYAGFGILGVLALLAGGISSALLSRVPDVEIREDQAEPSLLEPIRDAPFRKTLFAVGAFSFAMQVAGPFFPYYFTQELGVPMQAVALYSMLGSVGCLLSSSLWGRALDRARNPRRILFVAGNLMALAPLAYALGTPHFIRMYAPFDYFVSGAVSAGYSLASTTLVFSSCPKNRSPSYFSVYLGFTGLCGALGTFMGGALAKGLIEHGGFRSLWVIGTCLRLLVAWSLIRPLGGKRPGSGVALILQEQERV